MSDLVTPSIDWVAIGPVVALAGAGVAIVLLRALVRHGDWVYTASVVLALAGTAAAGLLLVRQWVDIRSGGPYEAIAGMVAVDGFAVFLGAVVVSATALAVLLASEYLVRRDLPSRPEYLALLVLSATGMLVMVSANDLIVVFVALETLSIPLYALAAHDRRRVTSLEAGMKYFLLGAVSSALFLYGVALVYGATGSTSLPDIAGFLADNALTDQGPLLAGMVLLLVGLGFKVAAVPFHMWTPDVYQGAPTPVTAFMASATKAAGFAALLRVLSTGFDAYRLDWRPAVFALAVLSLLVGSIVALVQTDVKRMLAYSSISHAGYILIGLEAGTARGVEAALVYLGIYSFMVIGSFAVVTVIGRRDDSHSLDDYRALATRRPLLAGLLAFFLLAQAGIPLTGGFVAKLEVFAAAADAQSYALLIVGVLAAVVAAFFYLRIVVTMYAGEATEPEGADALRGDQASWGVDLPTGVVLALTAAFTLWVGILPGWLLDFAADAHLLF